VQMHTTFWHLLHFAVIAILCTLWAPGELARAFRHREPALPQTREQASASHSEPHDSRQGSRSGQVPAVKSKPERRASLLFLAPLLQFGKSE
jgi:hypothetical protein